MITGVIELLVRVADGEQEQTRVEILRIRGKGCARRRRGRKSVSQGEMGEGGRVEGGIKNGYVEGWGGEGALG